MTGRLVRRSSRPPQEGAVDQASARTSVSARHASDPEVMGEREGVGPVRTCVGCRRRDARSRLLRVAADGDQRGPDGSILLVPDVLARRAGRGAWVHPDPACLDQAVRRRAFARALRLQGSGDPAAVVAHLAARTQR